MSNKVEMGAIIKSIRQEFGWTLQDLANEIDSSKSYMWEIENKENIRPSAEFLHRLAVALETTIEILLGIDDPQTSADYEVFLRKFRRLGVAKKRILIQIADIL